MIRRPRCADWMRLSSRRGGSWWRSRFSSTVRPTRTKPRSSRPTRRSSTIPELRATVNSAILKGKSAAFAWQRAIATQSSQLAALHNELLAARAADIRDVGQRVLQNLTGAAPRRIEAPANAILIAEDLTPSDTANLDRASVLGFCTTLGSATSHVAILARSLDIPAVAGIEPRALDLPNGAPVILDGAKGVLRLNPSAEEIQRIQERQQRLAARRKSDLEHADEPATTPTASASRSWPISAVWPIRSSAMTLGGEGVGLLRTEFLFLERATAPTEDEQDQVYREIAAALGPERPLMIRTLDVGGDKPLPYLPLPKEETRSWASAACASASTVRRCCAFSCARSCAPPSAASCW